MTRPPTCECCGANKHNIVDIWVCQNCDQYPWIINPPMTEQEVMEQDRKASKTAREWQGR